LGDETSAFTEPILTPPMEFRDEPSLVLDNMEWHRGFLNDVSLYAKKNVLFEFDLFSFLK
jgi:hypothetical protein